MGTVTISTELGDIEGKSWGRTCTFRGIRYGVPPSGDRRFLPASAAGGWSGVRDATRHPNKAWQTPLSEIFGPASPGELDEDCLFLTVATPSTEGSHRPVMVWIHGGGYTSGSANDYDGSTLAEQGDVVVVTVNYRLGLFGFLDLSGCGEEFVGSANNGIRDQILALEWVRDHIADFGGDPGNVTIFGESAGGGSVLALLAAPAADGLYHRAVAHSPASVSTPPRDIAPLAARELGVETARLAEILRPMTPVDVLDLQQRMPMSGGAAIDGVVVTRDPAEAIAERGDAAVPLIAGTNRDEGTLFTIGVDDVGQVEATAGGLARQLLGDRPPDRYLAALQNRYPNDSPTDRAHRVWADYFRRPSMRAALAATEVGAGGWVYRFDLPTTIAGGALGATHASEIAFTFNFFATPRRENYGMHAPSELTRDLAQRWSDTLIEFARTGAPNGAGLPEWPRYAAGDRRSLVLDEDVVVAADLDAEHRSFWGDD